MRETIINLTAKTLLNVIVQYTENIEFLKDDTIEVLKRYIRVCFEGLKYDSDLIEGYRTLITDTTDELPDDIVNVIVTASNITTTFEIDENPIFLDKLIHDIVIFARLARE